MPRFISADEVGTLAMELSVVLGSLTFNSRENGWLMRSAFKRSWCLWWEYLSRNGEWLHGSRLWYGQVCHAADPWRRLTLSGHLCGLALSSVTYKVGLQRKLSTEELMLLNCGVGEDS